jgi:hypothetical protein
MGSIERARYEPASGKRRQERHDARRLIANKDPLFTSKKVQVEF